MRSVLLFFFFYFCFRLRRWLAQHSPVTELVFISNVDHLLTNKFWFSKTLHENIIYLDYWVFWSSLKCCAQGQRHTLLTLICALPQKAQILPSKPFNMAHEQSEPPFLSLAHEERRFSCPWNRCFICEVMRSRRGWMDWRVVGDLHRFSNISPNNSNEVWNPHSQK